MPAVSYAYARWAREARSHFGEDKSDRISLAPKLL